MSWNLNAKVCFSSYRFQDVCTAHEWQIRPIPAAAKQTFVESRTGPEMSNPIYLRRTVSQLQPISNENLAAVDQAVQEWKKYATKLKAKYLS